MEYEEGGEAFDYSSIRELKEGIEQRDVDEWYDFVV